MTTEEAAASLFGAEDSASDLFASLGSDTSSDTFLDTSSTPADALSEDTTSWPETSQYSSQQNSYQPAVASPGAGYAPPAAGTGHTPSQGNRQYEPRAYAPQSAVPNTTPAAAFDPYAATTYEPYTPASAPATAPAYNSYASPAQSYAAPPPPALTSTYSPYAPATTTPSTPSASTTYAPSYSASAGNTSYAPQKVAVVPPTPVPASTLNRPKLSNAYDPPFPASRPTRRGVSASARSSAYTAYASPLPPTPPLPVAAGSQFTASAYPLPPAPPPAERANHAANWGTHPPPPTVSPYSPRALTATLAEPPFSKPPSFGHTPTGLTQHLGPRISDGSEAHEEFVDPESKFNQFAVDVPLRSSSPVKSTGPPRSVPRADSRSSQRSVRSTDTSYFPPTQGEPNEASLLASLSSRSRPASPESHTNGMAPANASPPGIPDRTASPASVHSLDRTLSPPSVTNNPYLPNSAVHRQRVPSPLKKSITSSYDPPKPSLGADGYSVEVTGSSHSANGLHNTTNQYLPAKHGPTLPSLSRNRSTSSGSVYPSSPENPYAPSLHGHGKPQRSETDYGSYVSRYNHAAPEASAPPASQEILMKPVQSSAYAPSPSLLGANDPLGRTSSRAPVFSFGFGGKLLTCFHGASMNTGFDVALSSRNSTGIQIRQLKKIIPKSALEASSASFPGPLFSDPGTPSTGLVRTTTTSSQTKTKKARLVKYLTDRAEEISQGIGYLHPGSVEGQQAEGKLVLVNLLKILVENDGRLSGTPQIDSAVRTTLVPRLEVASGGPSDVPGSQSLGFSSIAERIGDPSGVIHPMVPTSGPDDLPIATSILRPSAMDKIQDFLVRGERRKAYHYALDERLWAHALVIASSIDRDAWKEAVNEFLRTELGSNNQPASISGANSAQSINGREGLRVAYSLYSGQGSTSVQELVPQNLLSRATGRLQMSTVASHMTPVTPNFAAPAVANNIPTESLAAWADTAAMMLSSPMTADTSAALTALGDQLLAHQWVEAAHACYLLSPQTSPIGGIGNSTARIVLLGSRSPQVWPSFYKDSDPLIFTEILEFALSLTPPIKGQEPFVGLPHLQAYRYIRAMTLAELGELQLAGRYCEAITTSFGNRGSPYFTGVLLDQLKALSNRIVGLHHGDKSGFWKSTPSLDTIGRFLEGRFTKLVTGDADPGTPTEELSKPADSNSGPFSQYSTISSTTSSTSPSPQPSFYNLNSQPLRSGSAMGQSAHVPTDRASSSMEHVRRRPSSPAPRIASANASTTTVAQAPSAYNNYSPNPYSPSMATPRLTTETTYDEDSQEVSWWGSTSYAYDSANQTPMATTFVQVDAGISSSSEGFISLMDNASYSVTPAHSTPPQSSGVQDDDEEDLGFGNSKRAPKEEKAKKDESSPAAAPAATASERPGAKPAPAAASGSWFGRWWKRSDSTPGPIKANLGEETAFYYDKELKRWVNKKGGAEESKPAAPPPPPTRTQTASPGMTGPRPGVGTPPPARSASVADVGGPPPAKPPMRVRSNLAPGLESSSLPNSPLRQSTLTPPPPLPGRPKSQASKRAIRSRYVDVFQQEGEAA